MILNRIEKNFYSNFFLDKKVTKNQEYNNGMGFSEIAQNN